MKIYKCSRCIKWFWIEEDYEKHVEKNRTGKKKCKIIKCYKCNIKFRKESHLERHENFFCYDEYEKCKKCKKMINTKEYWKHREKCTEKVSTIGSSLRRHFELYPDDKYKKRSPYSNSSYRYPYNYGSYGSYGSYAYRGSFYGNHGP